MAMKEQIFGTAALLVSALAVLCFLKLYLFA